MKPRRDKTSILFFKKKKSNLQKPSYMVLQKVNYYSTFYFEIIINSQEFEKKIYIQRSFSRVNFYFVKGLRVGFSYVCKDSLGCLKYNFIYMHLFKRMLKQNSSSNCTLWNSMPNSVNVPTEQALPSIHSNCYKIASIFAKINFRYCICSWCLAVFIILFSLMTVIKSPEEIHTVGPLLSPS